MWCGAIHKLRYAKRGEGVQVAVTKCDMGEGDR